MLTLPCKAKLGRVAVYMQAWDGAGISVTCAGANQYGAVTVALKY